MIDLYDIRKTSQFIIFSAYFRHSNNFWLNLVELKLAWHRRIYHNFFLDYFQSTKPVLKIKMRSD